MTNSNGEGWRIFPEQQLSLDLPQVDASPPENSVAIFERERLAKELLRQLAWELGEQRAAIDIKALRERLIVPE